jgi:hydrogenase maturation factor
LAKKKAQLKALQEKKKVELAEKKAKEESLKKLKEKKKKEDEEFQKKIMIQELTGGNATTIGPTKSVEDMPPVDISAMKAYSAAIE